MNSTWAGAYPFVSNSFGAPTLTVATQVSTHIDVTVQLRNQANGATGKSLATLWVSATAGGVPAGTAPTGAVTIETGTTIKEDTSKVVFRVVSSTAGVIVIRLIGDAATTFYVNCAVGTQVASSAAVTFA